MYEDLHQKRRPKVPKCLQANGIRGFLGVLSPSKVYSSDSLEAKTFFDGVLKYRIYKRAAGKDEWHRAYQQHRLNRRT